MNTIVVYQSSTGFTKQYAHWIAEELSCEAVELKKVSNKTILENDFVIFGGWLMGGMVSGLKKMKKLQPKELIVFSVGSTPEDIVDLSAMKEQNKNIPFFYMTGGFRFEQLNFMVKGMLKTLKKSVAKKENKTPQEQFMADVLGTSFDTSDRKYIKPLVEYARNK